MGHWRSLEIETAPFDRLHDLLLVELLKHKNIYKTAAAKCSSAINKYHAAKELPLN